MIAAAGALAVTAAQPAEASVTLGPCTVTAITPTPVAVAPNGTKVAWARASAHCTASRQMQLELALYGDDLLSDDLENESFQRETFGPQLQTVGRVLMCSNPGETPTPCSYGSCDEDIGADELYSRVRARLRVAGSNPPAYGLWTAWTNGPTVTYYC
jgi:hypothetical protein